MKLAIQPPVDVHDTYVERINALLARGRDDEAYDLVAEFEAEFAHAAESGQPTLTDAAAPTNESTGR